MWTPFQVVVWVKIFVSRSVGDVPVAETTAGTFKDFRDPVSLSFPSPPSCPDRTCEYGVTRSWKVCHTRSLPKLGESVPNSACRPCLGAPRPGEWTSPSGPGQAGGSRTVRPRPGVPDGGRLRRRGERRQGKSRRKGPGRRGDPCRDRDAGRARTRVEAGLSVPCVIRSPYLP